MHNKTVFPTAFALLLLTGLFSGLLNGLLGTGGGVILVLFLRRYLAKSTDGGAGGDAQRLAYSMAVVCVLAYSLVSAALYYRRGTLPARELTHFLPGALIGGFVGAYLCQKIRLAWLNRIFAIVLILSGFSMVYREAGAWL